MEEIYNDEKEVLMELRKGSREAFGILYERYWHGLFRVAVNKIRDAEAAEELVQDLFVHLWEKRESLMVSDVRYYLYTSIRNKCINHIRSCMVREKYSVYYKAFVSRTSDSTIESINRKDLEEQLEYGLSMVPERSRQVFQLSRFEGKSVQEIASIFNVTEKAIEYHITKSLQMLRLYLKDFILFVAFLLYF